VRLCKVMRLSRNAQDHPVLSPARTISTDPSMHLYWRYEPLLLLIQAPIVLYKRVILQGSFNNKVSLTKCMTHYILSLNALRGASAYVTSTAGVLPPRQCVYAPLAFLTSETHHRLVDSSFTFLLDQTSFHFPSAIPVAIAVAIVNAIIVDGHL
jgi:hypothetical protein